MDPGQTRETLTELARLAAQVAELQARVLGHADDLHLGDAEGATSTATWWAHASRQTRVAAHRQVRLATALAEDRYAPVRQALAAGELDAEQAQVIIRAIADLPTDLPTDPGAALDVRLDARLVDRAVRHLVAAAAEHDPRALRIIGHRLLEVIAPEAADAHQARLLAREERHAAASCRFTLTDDGHGQAHGRFTLPTVQAAMLKKALLALAAPKHLTATEGTAAGRRPGPERLGQALCDYIERYPADRLPNAGGLTASIVVTIPLQTLTGGDAAGRLDTGEPISPGQARRLACEAGIIPAVLGGRSEPLDLGRTRRLHTRTQRLAIALRDRGCTTLGCDWPPGLCHTHHDPSWATGGHTNTKHARMLCPHHHTLAHHPHYQMTAIPNGKVTFHRRT